jgi:integrase
MDQCWEILRYLGWRCKDLERQHGITKEVIDAWMDYMILAIITTGGRQRECRELTRKKIFVEAHDKIIVKLTPEDHKTGSATDRGREYPLFVGLLQTELSIDFLYYLNHILPKNLGHDYIFFIRQNGLSRDGRESRRGDPIANEIYLADLVTRTVAAITAHLFGIENAKWTTPHDFRRIIATWVCTYGKPEHLPIYAELLGHSVEMLVKLYSKMRPGEHARQAHLAYADIAAREARIREWELSGQSELRASPAEMGPVELVVMLKGLVKKLWNALTDYRRSALLKILTREERELLDD